MILESAAVGPFFKNGYVVGCERTRQAVFIDPGDEVGQLLSFISSARLEVTHILLTHAHVDHVSGVAAAKRALGAPIYLHEADQFLYDRAVETGAMFGLTVEPPPRVDHYYAGEGPITFGDYQVRIKHTPGHCPGGVCLALSKSGDAGAPHLFVGDTLFAGSIGRTDLPGGNYDTLLEAITRVLFAFPDEAVVYSGHGPETTIGREKATNPFVLEYLASRRG
ncbi:MAG TPA: MBL fold metallo-hydrolase [Vicinamibacterales bacterium]|nr:MBL fold metallo-hydrolase [Vicinamibacterales bacterium]